MTNSFLDGDDVRRHSEQLSAQEIDSISVSTRASMLDHARRIEAGDAEFPSAFSQLLQPPTSVWIAGTLATAAAPCVAIVGTRQATPYGIRITRAIATACARNGVCVVSGLARGIDGAAHEATLDANGRTVAVLGTGIDVYFPVAHRTLQQRIARDGLVLTEMSPGERGHGGTFPRRNRLIAALAQLVVVVEAPLKSGTHLTVGHAEALGRRIAVVPGQIDSPQSSGSNQLIRDGMDIVTSPNDVLDMLSINATPSRTPLLDDDAAKLWHALSLGTGDIETLAQRAGLTLRNAAIAASTLEISGLVQFDVAGHLHASLESMPL